MRSGCEEAARKVPGVKGFKRNRPAGLGAAGPGVPGCPPQPRAGQEAPGASAPLPGTSPAVLLLLAAPLPAGRAPGRSPESRGCWRAVGPVCVAVPGGTTRPGSPLCPWVQGARLRDPLPKPVPSSPPRSLGVPGGGRAGEQPPGHRRSLPAGRRSTGSAAARRGSRKGSGDSQWLCRAAGRHPWEGAQHLPRPGTASEVSSRDTEPQLCRPPPPPQAVQAASLRLPFVKASCNPTAPEAVSEEKVLAKEATWENKDNCAVKKAK